MSSFHPNQIVSIVFDLNSLSPVFSDEDKKNFPPIIQVLSERDFNIFLISKDSPQMSWEHLVGVNWLKGNALDVIKKNRSLIGQDVFWITEEPRLHKELSQLNQLFAGCTPAVEKNGGMQYQYLQDILYVFHPSRYTAIELADQIAEIKNQAPKIPLIVGIGGPDECGHAYFVGELVDALENHDILVSGLDLTEILGTEFLLTSSQQSYWRSPEIKDWFMEHVIRPYTQGSQVVVENEPQLIAPYEVSEFPFFVAPEMVLVIWGTTIFVPELKDAIDTHILLDLSLKAATARIYGLDNREDFDPRFIKTYQENEGKYYEEYLTQFQVPQTMEYMIDFDNFNAFRIKKEGSN